MRPAIAQRNTSLEAESDPKFMMPVDETSGLRSFLILLWKKRRLIWKVAVCSLVLGAALALVLPATWQSTVSIMPPDQTPSPLGMLSASLKGSEGLSMIAGDMLATRNSGALFISILRSRKVAERLVNKFDLRRVYNVRKYAKACKILDDRTTITEDRKSGVISVSVKDRSPSRARDLAAAYVTELDDLVTQVSTSSARRERVFLEGRLKAVKEDLDTASRKLSVYSSKNATLDPSIQGKAMVDATANLEGQLIAAQSQLSELQKIYTADSPRMQLARARISELQHQLRKMTGSGNLQTKSDSAEVGIPSLRELPLLGVEYLDLYRRVKIEEAVYETLTKQYEVAKVQEAKEIPTVRVLDEPNVPEDRSGPPRLFITLMTMLLGLGVVVAYSIFSVSRSPLLIEPE